MAGEGPALLLDLAAEALRALAFLHDFGLIHRDLKPANLLVRREPRAGCRLVLLDFGLALRGGATDKEKTGPGGTLPYMAPELFSGAPADRKTDLYGLGALLWEAVHGKPPIELDGRDMAGFIERAREGKRARPPLPEGYPAGLSGWLDELLAPDPADRPSGAQEALARLNAGCGCAYEIETSATRAARLGSGRPPGLEDELERLWGTLSDPSGPRLVWVAGDAGSGKSRILRWLVAEGAGAGWEVVTGLAVLTRRATARAELATVGRLTDELERIAETKPALLLLDEAETAPPLAVELLDRVARGGGNSPFRIVAALRPSEIGNPDLRRLLADDDLLAATERIDLDPLDATPWRTWREGPLGPRRLHPSTSAGCMRLPRATHSCSRRCWSRRAGRRGAGPPRTARWKRRWRARVEALPPGARAWLEALFVLGRDASRLAVSRLCGVDEEEGLHAAEGLLRGRVSPAKMRAFGPLRPGSWPTSYGPLSSRSGAACCTAVPPR